MKKTIVLISLTVLVVLLFVSCAGMDSTGVNTDSTSDTTTVTNTNDESKVEYNVSLQDHECRYRLFKMEAPKANNGYEYTKYDGDYEIKQVGDIQLEMKLIEKEIGYFSDESTYQLKEYNAKLSIFDNDPYNFYMLGQEKKDIGVLKKYEESELSEEKLTKHCKDYIAEFVKDIDYSSYSYTFYTLFKRPEEYSGVFNGNRDKFYAESQVENGMTLNIKSYSVNYTYWYGEYYTNNVVKFSIRPNGDIYSITYALVEADWSKYALENEELTKIAKDFLDKYLVDDCKLLLYETRPACIRKLENDVFVFFDIDLSVEYKGETISHSTRLRIIFPDEITSVETYG